MKNSIITEAQIVNAKDDTVSDRRGILPEADTVGVRQGKKQMSFLNDSC
jgi:hypothetical protein